MQQPASVGQHCLEAVSAWETRARAEACFGDRHILAPDILHLASWSFWKSKDLSRSEVRKARKDQTYYLLESGSWSICDTDFVNTSQTNCMDKLQAESHSRCCNYLPLSSILGALPVSALLHAWPWPGLSHSVYCQWPAKQQGQTGDSASIGRWKSHICMSTMEWCCCCPSCLLTSMHFCVGPSKAAKHGKHMLIALCPLATWLDTNQSKRGA